MLFRNWIRPVLAVAAVVCGLAGTRAAAADTLTWHTNVNLVSADIQSVPLIRLLEGVSQLTGWQVYLEANITFNVSAKFTDLPSGQALRRLLGNLNFAFVPQTNSRPRLYVFQSSQANATTLVRPGDMNAPAPKPIPNELVITLKRGAKIEDNPCLAGGKIIGRLEAMNTYRLSFETEAAANAARECFSNNPDVEAIAGNYTVNPPNPVRRLEGQAAPDFNLKVKEQTGDCPIIVGVVDTHTDVAALSESMKPFFLPGISLYGDAPPSQELTHGTAMAETILHAVQTTSGGNWSGKILPVNVYPAGQGAGGETASMFDVAIGVMRAIESGANVINLSLGSGGESPFLHQLIRMATERGIVFFGAAGNEPVTTPTFPAAYPEVIAVTAGDHTGTVASYANRGSFVDIMTPGLSIVPFQGQSFAVAGTSTATAYASGLAAGLADANRNCPQQVIPAMRAKLPVKVDLGQ